MVKRVYLKNQNVKKRVEAKGHIKRVEADQKDRGLMMVSDESMNEHINPYFSMSYTSQDSSKEWDSWVHLVKWLHSNETYPEYVVTVPCVAPLRTVDDLNKCVELATTSGADVVMAVADSYKNPWFNMVTVDPTNAQARLVNEPPQRINNRQEAPIVYDVSTVTFILKCSFLLSATSIYDGDTRAIILPKGHCVDIDTEDDISYAEFLLAKRNES